MRETFNCMQSLLWSYNIHTTQCGYEGVFFYIDNKGIKHFHGVLKHLIGTVDSVGYDGSWYKEKAAV
jgi:hypothetical protein